MTVKSLEIDLASIDARWVVVGFGVDGMMDRLPGVLRRLGPHSIRFPETTTMSIGVPRLSSAAMSIYIVVVDHRACGGIAGVQQMVWDLKGSECLAFLISIGEASAQLPMPEGALHVTLTEPAGIELAVAALLLAVTGNGLIGIDLRDITNCLHAAGPVRAWLWRGLGHQTMANAASNLAQSAAAAGIPGADIAGATVMTIVPPAWTLHDIVELSGSLQLPEDVDCALAAFTDDGPDPTLAVVAFTCSTSQIG